MKLKNKRTGEIVDFKTPLCMCDDKSSWQYDSLSELEEDWEDSLDIWWLDNEGTVNHTTPITLSCFMKNKEIGNYFETREEAEQAVEKLKAWKRLKDKGFRFTLTPGVGSLDVDPDKFQIEINADMPAKWFCCDAVQKDLDACFGGEE